MPVRYETFADVLDRLGGIDPRRARLTPQPGKATEKDVLHFLDHEDRLFELVDGVLVEKVYGLMESALAVDLGAQLNSFSSQRDLGMVAGAGGPFRLTPKIVRMPDVSFVSWSQLPSHEYSSEPIPSLCPDLAVEVLSKGNTEGEMERKLREYFLAGTRLVWFVDPESRMVQAFTAPDESIILTEGGALDGGDVLPGFMLPLRELFARVPRPRPRRGGNGKRPARRKRPRR